MLFHPIDTKEAFNPANKNEIAHLWYHVHYNQMTEHFNKRKNRVEYVAKKQMGAIHIHRELKKVAENITMQRKSSLADLANHYHVRQLKAKPIARIIHGLGGSHVRETSLTLHPVYGVPYIPASSVKGVVRHWFIEAFCDGEEKKLAEHETGALVFGTQAQRGIVQFHDIFLINQLVIEPDVLTVHFKDYYGSGKPATDDQNPNPVTFLTVNVSDVDIYLTSCKYGGNIPSEELLKEAASWTAQALSEIGIGSKTSSGYGYFTNIEDVTETEFLPFVKMRQQEKEKQKALEAQEKHRREEEARLAEMSAEERLVVQIEKLTNQPQDQEKSKTVLYNEVIAQQNRPAAAALKAYWQRTGNWNVKKQKQKQYDKVQAIKHLLGE
ncbi:type III-B CRISPR module RAMP protein Cmr6 [Bacillus alveayuensis]|uniref:type III-B CRISPR module RAMP protein Cmr6 n=1 Tax=Aeribacillus alveayuensis TaxID=279215 RepID=UPI0005D0F8E9|nr:type III-B CRISPR module RAMP protein Cmr6 [Bacillus alveayuensis]